MSLVQARKLALLLQTRQNPHLNHLVASGAIYSRFVGKPYIQSARQLHSTPHPAASRDKVRVKPLKIQVAGSPSRYYRPSDPTRAIPPRYVQGPTLPGLRVVVKAMQNGDTNMSTKEIWDAIHNNSLGAEYTFPKPAPFANPKIAAASVEPTYPTHPVRSLRYMKSVLLATLEANGRARKVHALRPPNEEEMEQLQKNQAKIERRNAQKAVKEMDPNGVIPLGIDTWVWELIPPKGSKIPVEQRESIPMNRADTIWMESLDAETLRQFHTAPSAPQEGGAESTSITAYQSMEEKQEAKGSHKEARPSGGADETELNLAETLVQQWQVPMLKDEAASARAGVPAVTGWKNKAGNGRKKPVDWTITDGEKREKLLRRKQLLSVAPRSPHLSTANWSHKEDNGQEVVEAAPNKESDLFDDSTFVQPPKLVKTILTLTQPPRDKSHLNPFEPEYRQSRRGINDVSIGLKDPRRRQFGLHYGLPKQKELLRAANARGYDQEEWNVESQPPRDFSHLSVRRRTTREEQNAVTIRLLRHAARSQRTSSKSPAALPKERVKRNLRAAV